MPLPISKKHFALSIVLPTYNERENIRLFIPELARVFGHISHEIIVVDDSSSDGTAEEVRALQRKFPSLRLFSRPEKKGIGGALRLGYSRAGGDAILSSDADLSFTSADLKKLYDTLAGGYDLVVGSRHSAESHYETPNLKIKLKYTASRAGNALLKQMFRMPVRDFSANCRVMRRSLWAKLNTREDTNFFLFEMILLAKENGGRIVEVPVVFHDRRYGRSKINHVVEIPKAFFKMLAFISRRKFLK